MKKIFLLFAFMSLAFSQVFAQGKKDSSKLQLALSVWGGVSFPLKKFNISNSPAQALESEPGYAKNR